MSTDPDPTNFQKKMKETLIAEFPNWKDFKDPDLLRKFKELTFLDISVLPEDKLEEVLYNI